MSGTWDPIPSYLFFTTPGGSLTGGLTNLGCPFVPQEGTSEAATSHLTYAYNGWLGPMRDIDTNPNQQVRLRTHVTGTVEDDAGSTYHLSGGFLDSTTHFLFDQDLLFDGVGRVVLSGPAGVVVGTAELRIVTGPPDYEFNFTSIQQCTVKASA